MLKKYKKLLLIFSLSLVGCEKFVNIPPSPQLLENNYVFTDEKTTLMTVNGIYASLRTGVPLFLNGGLTVFTGLSAGELMGTASNSSYDPFYQHQILATNSNTTTLFWSNPYHTIYRCNAGLEALVNADQLGQSFKNQIKGELLVVRALNYFYMINLFNDVPLVLGTSYVDNRELGRTEVAKIYEQLIIDVELASTLLSTSYPTQGKTRPNKYVALSLLSRLYLYQNNWTKAAEKAKEVIESGRYLLTADLDKTFLINSSETIWELAPPTEARNTAEGALFIPASATAKPALTITDTYLKAYVDTDKRKAHWLKNTTVAGQVYYYPYKFKNRLNTPITEYNVVFRLAEQILIYAEALAKMGDIPKATAEINKIRIRAGLPTLEVRNSLSAFMLDLVQERQLELAAEWGHRWLDLKRWTLVDEVLPLTSANYHPHSKWYPIPNSQILYNPNLTQNEGYD